MDALDNAGVFAALDEQTDYATAEEILTDAGLGGSMILDPADGIHLGSRTLDH